MAIGPDENTLRLCAKMDKTLGQFMDEIEADFMFLLKNGLEEAGNNQYLVNQMFALFFYGIHNATSENSKLFQAMQKEYAPELSELEAELSNKKDFH